MSNKQLIDFPTNKIVKSNLDINDLYLRLSGAIDISENEINAFRNLFEIQSIHLLCEKIIDLENRIKELENK